MYKRCVSAQSALRQRELEARLLDAMLSQDYNSISISALCDGIGVPRKSFYRYFSGREGALCALVDHTLEDFYGELFNGNAPPPTQVMERFYGFWRENSRFLDAIVKNSLEDFFLRRVRELALSSDVVAENLRHIHGGVKKEYLVLFSVSGLFATVFSWRAGGYLESPREMASTAMNLMTRPMFSVMIP